MQVSQYSYAQNIITTISQIDKKGRNYASSKLRGREFVESQSGIFTYYKAESSCNLGTMWRRIIAFPLTFQDGDTYRWDMAKYRMELVPEKQIKTMMYKDVIKIIVDNSADNSSSTSGIGEIYLAKDIGVIEFTLTRSNGKVFSAKIFKHAIVP
jgi:hypothetical protein